MVSDFVALPSDIHISLLALVDIVDIISVRQTCTTLQALTNERVIWLNMLRKVCAEYHLFFPERLMQEMTTRELQDAACGPNRWLYATAKNHIGGPPTAPRLSRRIALFDGDLPTPFIGPPENMNCFQVHSWYLVPGGKYLVTWSSSALSVWDLRSRQDDTSGRLLSSVSVPFWAEPAYAPGTTMTVQPTANGNGLTIMTFFHRQQQSELLPEWFICQMYDISMDASEPELRCIASLEGPKDKKGFPCALHGDLLAIFIQPRELAVWNYRTDEWAIWSVAGRTFSDVSDILIQPNYVALFHHDKIAVWPIPPLSKVEDESTRFQLHDSPPVDACVTCEVPTQLIRRYRWVSPQQWYPATLPGGSSPIIGTKTHHMQDLINFDSFELIVSEDLSTASLSKRLPTVLLDQTVSRVQLRAQYSNLACVTIFGRDSLRIHPFAAHPNGSDEPVHLAKTGVITVPMSPVQGLPDLCPASSRIAFMQAKDYSAIHVWDL